MENVSGFRVVVDGRVLQASVQGPPSGDVVVFQTGTPSPPVKWPALEQAVRDLGWRLVTYQRPGYMGSDRQADRCVGDATIDVEAILDALGVERFVTVGWSGGGPHALACAALLPERCLAAATIGSVSVLNLVGESWWNGMTSDNAAAFRMAVDGEKSLRQHLEPTRRRFSSVTGAELSETLGRLVSQVDQASLSEEFADMLAMARRQAANHGIDGWVDDLLAFVRPWGFDPASIQTPTTIWHGEHDSFVPISHGQWLASRIPLAVPQLLAAEGHLSLVARRLDEILRGL